MYSFRWNISRYAGHLESMSVDQIDYTSVEWLFNCFVESWFLQKQESVFRDTVYVSDEQQSSQTTTSSGDVYDEFNSFFGEDTSTGTQDSPFQEQWYGFVDQPNASGVIERTYYDDWSSTDDMDAQSQRNTQDWNNQVSSWTKRYLESLIQMRTTQSFKTWN